MGFGCTYTTISGLWRGKDHFVCINNKNTPKKIHIMEMITPLLW
jgi:hypothetical protein